ncbi:MAG TPA: glycosyltransferase [bacterium]|nr:glycosyltransferase [bacterium]HOL46877.1 glycosyltransferase [bacterium]HPQ18774.1 glycosyltransferase [bacterium]
MDISIFITNYNGFKNGYIQEALPNIISEAKKYRKGKYEIIFVDDCSIDDSIKYVSENFPEIIIKKTAKNCGYQRASNFAVAHCQFPILISLNNDIKLGDNVLNKIVDYFNDENVFAVSTKVFLWDEKTYLAGKRIALLEKGHFKLKDLGDTITNTEMTLFATGGAAAFRKSMYLELGGFDDIYYPLYWEDIDLCYRALKRGWKVLYAPECIMYHKHQATIKTMYDATQLSFITARNSYIFFWKNISTPKFLFAHFFWSLVFFIRDFFNLKFRFHIAFLLALKKIFKIIKRKIKEKNFFIKTDSEILDLLKNNYSL